MKDVEILNALQVCTTAGSGCDGCPYYSLGTSSCLGVLCTDAIVLINKQKGYIAHLRSHNESLKTANAHVLSAFQDEIARAKADAIKEFGNALKERVIGIHIDESTLSEIIDELKEDMP